MDGERSGEPINLADYERLAEGVLDAGTYGYFAGGAGDEVTLRDNVAAFSRWQLRPRALVDVGEASATCTVMGAPVSMPVLVSPVAFQRMAHPDGEAAMARAAMRAGTIMCLSTLATMRPAEVARAAPEGRRWFQLYCFRDSAVTQALLDEAVDCGYEAIVLTVDAPRAGRRERDLRTGFEVPAEVEIPSVAAALGGARSVSVAEAFSLVDPTLTWTEFERLAAACSVPLLVKGVLTGEDAGLAIEHGAAGIVVSNHGGRQLDRVSASIDALEEVVQASAGRVPVFMDGGVRRGTDVVVALALGAEAVLVGRPSLWGLAVDGERGVSRVLELLRSETELALTLCGSPSPRDVARSQVRRAPAP